MISREYDKYILACDSCLKEIEKYSFQDCIDYQNENGWSRKIENGEWLNYCNECKGD